ncbi:MAG: sulfur carrier protein ThiS [Sulfitobacter sp.]
MRLLLNGAPIEAQPGSLADLLEANGFGGAKVATAVNGAFIPAPMRGETALAEGDLIEVLAPMQGG